MLCPPDMQASERSSQQGEAADVGSTAGEGGGCVVESNYKVQLKPKLD